MEVLAVDPIPLVDLAARLKRGAIRLDEALVIAKQIADALEQAHEMVDRMLYCRRALSGSPLGSLPKGAWEMSIVAVCALLVWGLAGDGAAAPASPSVKPASGPRRLSVSLAAGFTWGGPAEGIEAALRTGGYDDTTPYGCLFGFCSGPTSHPYSDQDEDPGESLTLVLRYLHDARFGVALLLARTPLQVTVGFKADTPAEPGFLGDYAHINSEVTVVAALATVGAADFAWLGVGPSVNLVELRDMRERSSKATTVGVVAEAGVRWPRASRVFFEVNAQYRWAASAEMGLFELAPPASLSASHATLAVGVGVRLGSPVGRQRN